MVLLPANPSRILSGEKADAAIVARLISRGKIPDRILFLVMLFYSRVCREDVSTIESSQQLLLPDLDFVFQLLNTNRILSLSPAGSSFLLYQSSPEYENRSR